MFNFFFKSKSLKKKHKQHCEQQEITAIKTSDESDKQWNKYFHKNPFYSENNTDFEVDDEKDLSNIRKKTTKIYEQNPVFNG